jgi:hypothetical protein
MANHADFHHSAANGMTSNPRVPVVEPVVDLEKAREKGQKTQ